MKSIFLVFTVFVCSNLNLIAQEGIYCRIQEKDLPVSISMNPDTSLNLKFSSNDVEAIFKEYRISTFEKACERCTNPYLEDVYLIKFNDIKLADELSQEFSDVFQVIEYYYDPIYLYAPNDYALELNDQRDLDLIRAKDAWEITKGNSNIIIGINDTHIDEDHEDLEDNINSVLSNGNPNGLYAYHGTIVSFCASGVTDNNVGLSSIGFNSNIMFETGASINDLVDLADEGAHIVNASYITRCNYSSVEQAMIDDIHDMGTIILAGAGNALNYNKDVIRYQQNVHYDTTPMIC